MIVATIHTEETRKALEVLEAGILQGAKLALRAATDAGTDDARATTLFRDRTGTTRGSIQGRMLPGLKARIEARGAAKLLEGGTVAHIIQGKRGGVLRFVANGQTIFRRMVHHPGTAPRPFMRHARDRAEVVAEYGVEEYVGYAIARAH